MSHLGSGVRFFSPFGPSFGLGTKAVLNPSACAAARSFWWAATIMISDGVRSSSSARSEEHTSELQSQSNLVCRLLLEKKKKNTSNKTRQSTPERHSHTRSPQSRLLRRRQTCRRRLQGRCRPPGVSQPHECPTTT